MRGQPSLGGITSETTLANIISRKLTLRNLFAVSLNKYVASFNTTLG